MLNTMMRMGERNVTMNREENEMENLPSTKSFACILTKHFTMNKLNYIKYKKNNVFTITLHFNACYSQFFVSVFFWLISTWPINKNKNPLNLLFHQKKYESSVNVCLSAAVHIPCLDPTFHHDNINDDDHKYSRSTLLPGKLFSIHLCVHVFAFPNGWSPYYNHNDSPCC